MSIRLSTTTERPLLQRQVTTTTTTVMTTAKVLTASVIRNNQEQFTKDEDKVAFVTKHFFSLSNVLFLFYISDILYKFVRMFYAGTLSLVFVGKARRKYYYRANGRFSDNVAMKIALLV